MGHTIERLSKQTPPPRWVFVALVDEIDSWWIPLEAECLPVVIESSSPNQVVWSSPFTRWPHDRVQLRIDSYESGSSITLHQEGNEALHEMDAAAMRHRWGQHLDADLRYFLDVGCAPDAYHFTPYRSDVEDWSIQKRIEEEQLWRVEADLWARVVVDPEGGWWGLGVDLVVPAGSLLWVVGWKYHRMSVRCIVEQRADLDNPLVPGDLRRHSRGGMEVLVALAEFGKHLHLEK